MARIVSLLALVALTAPAWGRELSLEEALSYASTNRDLQTVQRREALARAGEGVARAAFDPTLVASTQVSGTEAAGFVAGYPMESKATASTSSVGVQGTTPTGTTWNLSADLGRDSATTLASLGGMASENEQKTWDGLVDLTVSQDLLAPFRSSTMAIAAREASERVDTAEVATVQAQATAVVTIASTWWTWASAHSLAEAAERAVVDAKALEAQIQARFDEGLVARLELTRATSDRLSAERDLLSRRADVRAASDQLLLSMGQDPGEELEPMGDGAIAGGEVDVARSIERALEANPAVISARWDVTIAENALRDGRRSGLPELTASGSVGMASLSDTATSAVTDLAANGLPRWAVGVDFSVPLGGRAARNTRSSGEAELDIAKLALASVEQGLRADVRAAADAVDTSRASVELAIARLEVAKETEDGEQARVDEGASRIDDLISARNARVDAEADVVSAKFDRARAELDLLQLEGRLGGPDGV